jgi:hypothetical protein
MRVQLELPETTVSKLRSLMNEVGLKTYSEIFGYALTGLDWMVRERRAGRMIVSTDQGFRQVKELSMPIFDALPVPTEAQPQDSPAPSAVRTI